GACMAVYIEDGGANDDDGVVNGVIEDPLSPSTTRLASGRSSGGSVGLTGLAGLLLLLLFALSARRAAARRR
ncbi:MAG: hypothetical protein OXU50_00435, partial [Gammaproteobacteria bacterium]|nr:hypothetical protein [Gammaproteobacteria bacterium]